MTIIGDQIKAWFLGRALKKAAMTISQAAASYVLAHSDLLTSSGISVSINPDLLAMAILGASEVLRSWLKAKYPVLSWL